MARTVDEAFREFMSNVVDLDPEVVKAARSSQNNLLLNIKEFDNDSGFFDLCEEYNLHFGSFYRKTKCRPLNDIDLMVGISASGATYSSSDSWDNVRIFASNTNEGQMNCQNQDGTLNSTLVLNCFKKKLEHVREYKKSEIKRNGEAVTLNLISKDWSFDIVPCFYTVTESNGRSYYLIPNGKGNWKKTEPTIEYHRLKSVAQKHSGKVLDTIRLIKYWNKRRKMPTITSYVLETMIIDYFENNAKVLDYLDYRFMSLMNYIHNNIYGAVMDSKMIEGNINTLDDDSKWKIYNVTETDYKRAYSAYTAEVVENDHEKAINLWRDILGGEFPQYE